MTPVFRSVATGHPVRSEYKNPGEPEVLPLDLAGTSHEPQSRPLHAALIAAARCDAYAARDVLAIARRKYLTIVQRRDLHVLVRAAVDHAEVAMKRAATAEIE